MTPHHNRILTSCSCLSPKFPKLERTPSDLTPRHSQHYTSLNYDIWSPRNLTVGPNAPLNDTCWFRRFAGVQKWYASGIPLLRLSSWGVASYDHSFLVVSMSRLLFSSHTLVKLAERFLSGAYQADSSGEMLFQSCYVDLLHFESDNFKSSLGLSQFYYQVLISDKAYVLEAAVILVRHLMMESVRAWRSSSYLQMNYLATRADLVFQVSHWQYYQQSNHRFQTSLSSKQF